MTEEQGATAAEAGPPTEGEVAETQNAPLHKFSVQAKFASLPNVAHGM